MAPGSCVCQGSWPTSRCAGWLKHALSTRGPRPTDLRWCLLESCCAAGRNYSRLVPVSQCDPWWDRQWPPCCGEYAQGNPKILQRWTEIVKSTRNARLMDSTPQMPSSYLFSNPSQPPRAHQWSKIYCASVLPNSLGIKSRGHRCCLIRKRHWIISEETQGMATPVRCTSYNHCLIIKHCGAGDHYCHLLQ